VVVKPAQSNGALRRHPLEQAIRMAITYALGKRDIVSLRTEATRSAGSRFSPKEFHLLLMKHGTIPAGYFREAILSEMKCDAKER
jgi:hypothetical protein